MKHFKATDFVKAGNDLHFGPGYEGYGAVQLRHVQTRKTIDILINAEGLPISAPDAVTGRMRERMQVGGDPVRIVALAIENETALSIIFPEVAK